MNAHLNATEQLECFLTEHRKIVVLTGAGVSAPSGIPTYRDGSGRWLYRKPIQHKDFLRDLLTRKRYWSRSISGWPYVRDAIPNNIHKALAGLEVENRVELLITQNVDRLHQRAGSAQVIDLHGRLDRVRCLDCDNLEDRENIQRWLLEHNEAHSSADVDARPDGDADIEGRALEQFKIPACARCQGVISPDVVFFGGTVPRARVDSCASAIQRADALLVVGSSLQVYSGYRFCRQANDSGKSIGIINPGVTRADPIATLKLAVTAEAILPTLVHSLNHR